MLIIYAFAVWESGTLRNLDKTQTMQNIILGAIIKIPRLSQKDIIGKEIKIHSIRKTIKTLATTFYNNLNNIGNNLIKSYQFTILTDGYIGNGLSSL